MDNDRYPLTPPKGVDLNQFKPRNHTFKNQVFPDTNFETEFSDESLPMKSKKESRAQNPHDPERPDMEEDVRGRLFASTMAVKNFGENVIPQILATPNVILKIFWLLAYIGFTGVFAYQMTNLAKLYLSYPVATLLSIDKADEVRFPSVTFCNNNPVRKSVLSRLSNYVDLAELDEYVESEMFVDIQEDFFRDSDFEFKIKCDDDQIQCPNTNECISQQWVCDGEWQCRDGWDEGVTANATDPLAGTLDCSVYWESKQESEYSSHKGLCLDGWVMCSFQQPICAVPCDGDTECTSGDDESDKYGCEAACGGDKIASASWSSISSPGWSTEDDYTNGQQCGWNIVAAEGKVITFEFTGERFGLEADVEDQCEDYVRIFDGANDTVTALKIGKRGRFCGDTAPVGTVSTSSNKAFVFFKSDFKGSDVGFQLKFMEDEPPSAARNRRVAESNGENDEDSVSPDLAAKLSMRRTMMSKRGERKRGISDRNKKRLDAMHARKFGQKRDHSMRDDLNIRRSTRGAPMTKGQIKQLVQGIKRRKRTTYEYNVEVSDEWYWENYDSWYENFDPMGHYSENLEPWDWIQAYEESIMPDYSDFRMFALFNENEMEWYGSQGEDFIAQCTFDGRECDHTDFTQFQNPRFGNCFSFNSVRDKPKNDYGEWGEMRDTSKTGQQYGLKVTLFLDNQEYIGVLGQDTGAQIVINDAAVMPIPEAHGMGVSAGMMSRVAMRKEIVKRKGGKYGNCVSAYPASLGMPEELQAQWPYTQEFCELYCHQNHMYHLCNCVDNYLGNFYDPDDAEGSYRGNELCKAWNTTQRTCRNNVYKLIKTQDPSVQCPCNPACDTNKFQTVGTETMWPTESYTAYLIQILRRESESERLQEYLEEVLTDEELDMDKLNTDIRKNFARVEIYFQHLNFEKIEEKPSYLTVNLLSDFGGNIGLWIGWSVLTFLEIFVLIFNVIHALIFQRL